MNLKLKNITYLFKNVRTRTMVIVTGLILVFGFLLGLGHLLNKSASPADSAIQLKNSPDIKSIPGGMEQSPSPDYQRLQQQQNLEQAELAEKTGTSAIPTLLDTSQFKSQNLTNCCCESCSNSCGNPCNSNGKPATQRSGSQAIQSRKGLLIYDAHGKLIGHLGADGKVHGLNGAIIGELGADGVVRAEDGTVIGSAAGTAINDLAYDMSQHVLGPIGADGKIRDSKGNIVGVVGPDGIVRDLKGAIIGNVRDNQGSIIAARNAMPDSQKKLGDSLNTPNSLDSSKASVSLLRNTMDNTNPELQAILDRQAQQISAQKAEQLKQQMQASMTTQANQLFVAWASPTQQYVPGVPTINQNSMGGVVATNADSRPPVVKAGTIMNAVLLTAINSDEPGPVLAEIVQGKFKGARLVGTLSNQGKKVLLAFNSLTLPQVSKSIPINSVAIDEGTARTALSSYTNNHYWLRYGTLFASAFIEGYGQSFLNAGSPYAGAIVIDPNNDDKAPELKPRDRMFVGLGQVGVRYASALGNIFNTPPTVHVYSGTPMGILFLSDVAALPE
jgi:intracellular multiplication protein IcmE